MTATNVGTFILISAPCEHCKTLAKEFRLAVDPRDGQLMLALDPCPACGNKSSTLVWHHELVIAVKAEDERIEAETEEQESPDSEEDETEDSGPKGPLVM